MCIGVIKYEKNPEYKPNTAGAPECVEHGLPPKLFCHDAADRVAQNQPKLLSCKLEEHGYTLLPNSLHRALNMSQKHYQQLSLAWSCFAQALGATSEPSSKRPVVLGLGKGPGRPSLLWANQYLPWLQLVIAFCWKILYYIGLVTEYQMAILALLQWRGRFQGQWPTSLHTSLLECPREAGCRHTHRRTHQGCSLVAQSPSGNHHQRRTARCWLQFLLYIF